MQTRLQRRGAGHTAGQARPGGPGEEDLGGTRRVPEARGPHGAARCVPRPRRAGRGFCQGPGRAASECAPVHRRRGGLRVRGMHTPVLRGQRAAAQGHGGDSASAGPADHRRYGPLGGPGPPAASAERDAYCLAAFGRCQPRDSRCPVTHGRLVHIPPTSNLVPKPRVSAPPCAVLGGPASEDGDTRTCSHWLSLSLILSSVTPLSSPSVPGSGLSRLPLGTPRLIANRPRPWLPGDPEGLRTLGCCPATLGTWLSSPGLPRGPRWRWGSACTCFPGRRWAGLGVVASEQLSCSPQSSIGGLSEVRGGCGYEVGCAAGAATLGALSPPPPTPTASVGKGRDKQVQRSELSREWPGGFPEGQGQATPRPQAGLTPSFPPSQLRVPRGRALCGPQDAASFRKPGDLPAADCDRRPG